MMPPAPNGRDRKGAGVMVRADIDKAGVAADVVNAKGIGPRHLGRGKVVPAYRRRLFGGPPLLADVGVIPDQFFLLGINRDHWMLVPQASFHGGGDVAELRVAVRMVVVALLGLTVALEAVVEVVQQLGDLHVADRMILPGQFFRNGSRALTGPAQRRLRVAPRVVLDEGFQRVQELRVRHGDRFATRSRTADPAGGQHHTVSNLLDAFGDPLTRQSARTADETDASMAQCDRLTGRHEALRTLV